MEFGQDHDWAVVLKAVRGGYDGRGVWLTETRDEALAVFDENFGNGAELIVEQKVPMRRELSRSSPAHRSVRAPRAGGGDRAAQRSVRGGAGPGTRPR